MIFSKLFKAKWQHKNANVRVTAIDSELDAINDQAILIDLATTDSSDLVRKAALIKLADSSVWLNAFETNTDSKVQQFAQKQVKNILFDQHSITLTQDQKLAMMDASDKLKVIAKAVSLEAWLTHEQQPDLVIKLFNYIAKPQLLLTTFAQKQNDSVQQVLLANLFDTSAPHTLDISLLEKLLKKSNSATITSQIEQTIATQKVSAEKPVILAKQLQLNLSKLLALKDINDYGEVLLKRTALENEWLLLESELTCLPNDQRQSIVEKHQTINQQLDKLFVKKAELYQQALIEKQLEHDKAQERSKFNCALAEINKNLITAIYESNEVDEIDYQNKLESLILEIKASVLNAEEKDSFLKKVETQQTTLTKLPVIAQSITDATHLISRISQLNLPTNLAELNERQPIFNDWLTQYKTVEKQSFGIFPDSIRHAFDVIKKEWVKGLAPLNQQQKTLLIQTQKKMAEFNRLASIGKFNACFGIFKGVKQLYEQLNDNQKLRIQREYEQCEEKITELGDWEHYIATPRKEELLAQVQALANAPLNSPVEQAEKVKEFRKKWNLLGHAEDDVEKALNQSFNKACEQAFEPCRMYYNEQEQLREQHLATRLQIIEHAHKTLALLTENDIDHKVIEGQLTKLQQRWREAGEVERTKYKKLHKQFTETIAPVKRAITEFHYTNSELKKALIEKAKQALEDDNVSQSVNTAKLLQQEWKTIGFCGTREENRLWKLFRDVNDAIFANLSAVKVAEKIEREAKEIELSELFDKLQTQVTGKADSHAISATLGSANELLTICANEKLQNKALIKRIEKFVGLLKKQQEQAKESKRKANWLHLFSLLDQIATNKVTIEDIESNEFYCKTESVWQKKIQELLSSNKQADRAISTLELEILAGIESPQALKSERMKVQIGLMQEQMSSGAQVNLDKSLQEWLSLGQLTEIDAEYIARIKPIYCN